MLRKTLTILSLIGLLISVGLWAASYWNIRHRGQKYTCGIKRGAVTWMHNEHGLKYQPSYVVEGYTSMRTIWRSTANMMWRSGTSGGPVVQVIHPLWKPTLFFGSIYLYLYLPMRLRRKREKQRNKLGLCVNCGYDLRASKDRCPECGQVVCQDKP